MDTTSIIKPYLTEKTMTIAMRGWYTFVVQRFTGKAEIAHAIEELYKVTVKDIRTITVHGKMKRAGRKQQATVQPTWKKAMVKLADGQTIDAFQIGNEPEKSK